MKRHKLVELVLAAVLGAGPAAAADFTSVRDVVYVERGTQSLAADVDVPQGAGPFPGVLLVHGGAWRGGRKTQMAIYGRELAAAGFTCVAIDYRLAAEHPFPAQIEDCKSAVRWMRHHATRYKIDPDRLGAFGYSAGGHLVALLGTSDPSCGLEGPDDDGTSTRLACVVAGGAPCDFRLMPKGIESFSYWLGGTRGERPEAYELASPLAFVTRDDPPALFVHGEADRLVPQLSPKRMIQRLNDVGVPAELCIVPDAGHVQAFTDAGARLRAVTFLTAHLKPPKPGAVK